MRQESERADTIRDAHDNHIAILGEVLAVVHVAARAPGWFVEPITLAPP